MINVMVDIEGMNKLPKSSHTRILQVAATAFDMDGITGEHYNEFLNSERPVWTLDDEDTQDWWRKQPNHREMLSFQRTNGIKPRDLCLTFNLFIKSLQKKYGEVTIWACHPEYDITAMYEYYHQLGVNPAWPFYAVKDYATIRDLYKYHLSQEPVTHWANEDVLRQIKLLLQCHSLGCPL